MKPINLITIVSALLVCGTACLSAEWNVETLGAKGDGVMDCTAIFQQALDDAGKAGGGIVNVPAGKFRINGNLFIPFGVTLQGTYRSAPLTHTPNPEEMKGSVLLAYAGRGSVDGKPFVSLDSSATIAGFIITYPESKQSIIPPVPYPPCIAGSPNTDNGAVIDCALLNPYEGIHFVRSARFLIRNVQGYPIKRGIFVDQCYDIGKIENIHFWPFGIVYKPDDPYCKWINLNGVAFEFARTDWQYVLNTFCFGYGVGYKFSEYESGGCNGNFVGLGADSCERALLVEQAQGPGLLITNGEFVGRWSSLDAVTCEIGPKTAGKVSLNNCSFWGPINRCVLMNAPDGQFTANACNFVSWDVQNTGAPALQVDAGRVILQGNTFANGTNHVKVGPKVKSAIIMGNQTAEDMVIHNSIGKKLISIGNTVDDLVLTAAAKYNYKLTFGVEGDSRYLKGWSGREPALEWTPQVGTKRWSADKAQITLPVVPNKAYKITVDVAVPQQALMANAGLYFGNKKIMSFTKAGASVLTSTISPVKSDTVTLNLRVKNWRPNEVIPDNTDNRLLGVAVRQITMKAAGAGNAVYSINTGELIK